MSALRGLLMLACWQLAAGNACRYLHKDLAYVKEGIADVESFRHLRRRRALGFWIDLRVVRSGQQVLIYCS